MSELSCMFFLLILVVVSLIAAIRRNKLYFTRQEVRHLQSVGS